MLIKLEEFHPENDTGEFSATQFGHFWVFHSFLSEMSDGIFTDNVDSTPTEDDCNLENS